MASIIDYRPSDFGKKEEELVMKFRLQMEDAKTYFTTYIKPRLDRSYKLYISYNGDRAREIKNWQANISVPYIQAVVETLKPRILDARPDFTVQGRNEDDQAKARKVQQLADYTWEIAKMDATTEAVVSSALIYGTGYMQVGWKKDVRRHRFLKTKDLLKKKYEWVEKDQTFYDAPFCEWVDNYSLWYDWHNVEAKSKQYWMKRLVLTEMEIRRRYPYADKKRLEMVLNRPGGDLIDYSWIRNQVKNTHSEIVKGADYLTIAAAGPIDRSIFMSALDSKLKMYEVFEWWRPFEDEFAVMVNYIPILKGGTMPIPYDFKESPFIATPYLKLPGEFEGYGIPMLLENPQIMLNMIKNQRLDAMTLSIHKMWVVNPLANINKEELVTRPFGIIYSTDPNGVREVQFSDIKQSAYREEELLKSDMRYSSGVDDFSMGVGQAGGSATEVRHLRESTLERVRLFVNHLGDSFSLVLRYWISMYRQFQTDDMNIRIIGDDGKEAFPLIEKDDLIGNFDFKASVVPSIAGQNDVKKKQDMDLFQLLVNMPFVDQQKLTSKILWDFDWDLESIVKGQEQPQPQLGPDGQPLPPQVGPDGQPIPQVGPDGQPMPPQGAPTGGPAMPGPESNIPVNVRDELMALLGRSGGAQGQSPFAQAGMPINLLQAGGPPPTVKGVPAGKTTNPRGMNRTGKVNTNVSQKPPNGIESQLNQQASNLQR